MTPPPKSSTEEVVKECGSPEDEDPKDSVEGVPYTDVSKQGESSGQMESPCYDHDYYDYMPIDYYSFCLDDEPVEFGPERTDEERLVDCQDKPVTVTGETGEEQDLPRNPDPREPLQKDNANEQNAKKDFVPEEVRGEPAQTDIAPVECHVEKCIPGEAIEKDEAKSLRLEAAECVSISEEFKPEDFALKEPKNEEGSAEETVQIYILPVESDLDKIVAVEETVQNDILPVESDLDKIVAGEETVQNDILPVESDLDKIVAGEETVQNDILPVESDLDKIVVGESVEAKTASEGTAEEVSVKENLEDGLLVVEEPLQSSVNPVKEEIDVEDSEFQTANEEREDDEVSVEVQNGKFSAEQLKEIWELAKKLCEARCTYNANVCRRLTPNMVRKIQERKKREPRPQVQHCRPTRKMPNPITNGGVCTIGKGDAWDDPPEWNWGQPLPEEICEVIPSKPPAETPTITLSDDECTAASSPKRFKEELLSIKSEDMSFSPRLKTSKETYEAIILDSDDELPDFRVELGLEKTIEPSPKSCYEIAESSACTVVAVAPTVKVGTKKRKLAPKRSEVSRNQNMNSLEVVTLGSSEDSDADADVEVMPPLKKQTAGEEPEQQKPAPNSSTSTGSKNEWSCPICFETKDSVPSTMSTNCGHVFCGPCLTSSVKLKKQCPTCRRKLTPRQIHYLYM